MTKSNLPTTTSNLIGSLLAVETQIVAPQVGDGAEYLKLTGATGWTYGQDSVETQEGAKWAINPASMAKGFIAWSMNSTVIGDVLKPVTEGLVLRSELPELTEKSENGWTSQCGFQLVCLTGEDAGTNVMYKASTQGADKEFARLYNEIITKAKSGSSDIVPIVLLDSGSYPHKIKKYGQVTFPIFDIVGWQGLEDTELEETDEAPEIEEEVEEVVEENAPQKRRRRRKVA
jgi:hypothetical protein